MTHLHGHLDLGSDGGGYRGGKVHDEGIGDVGIIPELHSSVNGKSGYIAEDGTVGILDYLNDPTVVFRGGSRWYGACDTCYNEKRGEVKYCKVASEFDTQPVYRRVGFRGGSPRSKRSAFVSFLAWPTCRRLSGIAKSRLCELSPQSSAAGHIAPTGPATKALTVDVVAVRKDSAVYK